MNPQHSNPSNYPSSRTVQPGSTTNPDPISFDVRPQSIPSQGPDSRPLNTAATETEEEVVRLLEERLVIDRSKRKVGDVIVRKEVETRMIEVPVRRERLIVEQVGSEHRQLAAIDLGQGEVIGVDWAETPGLETTSGNRRTISGSFTSLERASQILNELTKHLQGQYGTIRLEVTLKDEKLQEAYQTWLDRHQA